MSAPSQPRIEQFTLDQDVSATPEVELVLGAGTVSVELIEQATETTVTLRAGQSGWWQQRLGGVLAALGQPTADNGEAEQEDPIAAEALAGTEVTWSPRRNRLLVRTQQTGPLRAVALDVVVTAPAGSDVRLRGSSAGMDVVGRAGSLDAGTGSGEVGVQETTGRLDVRTGSGSVRIGRVETTARIRTGSGDVTVDALTAGVEVVTGSGDVRLGVGSGVLAELDVRTGSGTARSELPVLASPPEGGDAVLLKARTGSGDVVVHAAS